MNEEFDKTKLKDVNGRYLIQGLFLEERYDPEQAIFTYDGEDKLYKGKQFISMKNRYLEWSDPTEYQFAIYWLYDWPHWKRLCANKVVSRHIDKWRDELYIKLRSEGINTMVNLAVDKDSYQAAKYLADCGWDVNKRGRPTKEEVEGAIAKRAEEQENWNADLKILKEYKEKNK